jgi:hypothetical protein
VELTLQQAEKFVAAAPSAQWNGWDIDIYSPQDNAFMRTNGAFFQGKWCLKFTVGPNSEGKYVISKRNSASATKSWH